MLSGYQCETVAFATDGGYVCHGCLTAELGEIAVTRIENGLDHSDIAPVIRYHLDEQDAIEADAFLEYLQQEYENVTSDWSVGHDCWRFEAWNGDLPEDGKTGVAVYEFDSFIHCDKCERSFPNYEAPEKPEGVPEKPPWEPPKGSIDFILERVPTTSLKDWLDTLFDIQALQEV